MMKRIFLIAGAIGLSLTAVSLGAAEPPPAPAQQPASAQQQPQPQFVEEQQSFTIVAIPCGAPAGNVCAKACPDQAKDHDKPECRDGMKCPDQAKDHDKAKCRDGMKCPDQAKDHDKPDYSDNDYALAYELLELTGAPENLAEANDIIIAVQMQQTPALKPAHAAFKEFFARHCSYEAMKRDLARVHLETFTRDELKKLIDFFKSPVGRKLARCRGGILRKSLALREQRIHANLPELQKNVEAAMGANADAGAPNADAQK